MECMEKVKCIKALIVKRGKESLLCRWENKIEINLERMR